MGNSFCSTFIYVIKSYMILKMPQMNNLMLSYVMPNVLVPLKQLQFFYCFQNMTFWPTFNWGFYRIENYCNLSETACKGYSWGNILLQYIQIHFEIIHDAENKTNGQTYADLLMPNVTVPLKQLQFFTFFSKHDILTYI